MRMMLTVRMDTQMSNELVKNGKMPGLMKEFLDRLQPEAAYFTPLEGRRACLVVFDLADPSQLPVITDPLFQNVGAEVTIQPVMSGEELMRGLAAARG